MKVLKRTHHLLIFFFDCVALPTGDRVAIAATGHSSVSLRQRDARGNSEASQPLPNRPTELQNEKSIYSESDRHRKRYSTVK
ncbi:MAG: hypothetical protein ACRC2R_14945 [Xenococcaceae cyanobacterium]